MSIYVYIFIILFLSETGSHYFFGRNGWLKRRFYDIISVSKHCLRAYTPRGFNCGGLLCPYLLMNSPKNKTIDISADEYAALIGACITADSPMSPEACIDKTVCGDAFDVLGFLPRGFFVVNGRKNMSAAFEKRHFQSRTSQIFRRCGTSFFWALRASCFRHMSIITPFRQNVRRFCEKTHSSLASAPYRGAPVNHYLSYALHDMRKSSPLRAAFRKSDRLNISMFRQPRSIRCF